MASAQKQASQDPVCGMIVDEHTAAGHTSHEGTTYHFCCPRCQKLFEADPAKYLNRKTSLPVISKHDGGCGCAEVPQHPVVQLAPASLPPRTAEPPAPVLHHDPVCGMDIEEQDAAGSTEYKGTLHYFCSIICLEKFKANPEQHLELRRTETPPAAQVQDVEYTCPMDPEVRQKGPGTCPKCGMA